MEISYYTITINGKCDTIYYIINYKFNTIFKHPKYSDIKIKLV
jgi:hypothetical protein